MRDRDWRRVTKFIGCVMSGMLVVACSGDDQSATPAATPTADETVTPSPEETPVPTTEPTPSVDPTEALEDEITEFFEEYIDLVNMSWGSKEALDKTESMFTEGCNSCVSVYRLAMRAHREGLSYDGDLGELESVEISSHDGEVVVFVATTSSTSAALVDQDGDVVHEFSPTKEFHVVYQAMRSESGEWILVRDEVLS